MKKKTRQNATLKVRIYPSTYKRLMLRKAKHGRPITFARLLEEVERSAA